MMPRQSSKESDTANMLLFLTEEGLIWDLYVVAKCLYACIIFQNNYLMMPVASKDSDSAHSEDSTNTDSGRGSDTTEQTTDHRGKKQKERHHYHKFLNNISLLHRLKA